MQYFIESASLEAGDYLKINSPEEIKFLDPASGSGHILVYAFELLTKIYEEEGYNSNEIPQLIIENNLYGFEIDERAAQLSGLALMMKAREYHRRVFKEELKPNTLFFNDIHVSKDEIKDLLKSTQIQVSDELMHDLFVMKQATNFGSLIIPHTQRSKIEGVLDKFTQLIPDADIFKRNNIEAIIASLKQLLLLGQKFHCVVANPPYMGGRMNNELSEFVKLNYPDSKSDLMACFIERSLTMLPIKGFMGMINQHSWMFLRSYERLRKRLVDNILIDTLLHLGPNTFPEIGGEVVQNAAFTIFNNTSEKKGKFIRLVEFDNSETKRLKMLYAISNNNCGWYYSVNQKEFKRIEGNPFGYWASENLYNLLQSKSLSEMGEAREGLTTGQNDFYLRLWYEVNYSSILFKCSTKEQSKASDCKWYPINKDGTFRRWYGNQCEIVNWQNNGYELQNTLHPNGKRIWAHNFNLDYIFKPFITWSSFGSKGITTRYFPTGFIFDTAGLSYFPQTEDLLNIIVAFTNSKIILRSAEIINPALSFKPGYFGKLPFPEIDFDKKSIIDELTTECIEISKNDWNKAETSWDFQENDLLSRRINHQEHEIHEIYDSNKQFWKNKFYRLHKLEEKINKEFIEIYQMQDELESVVPLEDITILQNELNRKLLKKYNKQLVRDKSTLVVNNYHSLDLPIISKDITAQFISYSIGCFFGRYSLDNKGIVLANQGEMLQDFLFKINKTSQECSFLPDADNIIPILDGDWFEDDIVGKFHQFLIVTFGEKNFNKNLAFIEEQVGKDIRKYFIKDFYPDHIIRYRKRPIYWMFSSPKGSFNVLIYMHRYTPDTVSNILNKYLKEFIGKLNTRKEHLERVKETGSASDKTKAIKESDNIQKMLVELHEYERDILYHLATERIEIDLDDGVLVNYNKFGKAVKEVNGLNDPATKKKVKQFDWIDTSQIR